MQSTPSIKIHLKDKVERIIFTKRSIGEAIDTFVATLMGTPFETLSGVEVASYTSYWASLLTMATFLFGNATEMIEEKYEDKKAWCHYCQKYVSVPWTDTPIWKLSCPECGRKPLTSLSPKDKL